MKKSMQQWYDNSKYQVRGTNYFGTIEGSEGWSLVCTDSEENNASYRLSNDRIKVIQPYEHHYQEAALYWYAICKTIPIFPFDIYAYVSKAPGNEITFREKEYCRGTAAGLGISLQLDLLEVGIMGTCNLAIRQCDVKTIVTKSFPGLRFKIAEHQIGIGDYNQLKVNWQSVERKIK